MSPVTSIGHSVVLGFGRFETRRDTPEHFFSLLFSLFCFRFKERHKSSRKWIADTCPSSVQITHCHCNHPSARCRVAVATILPEMSGSRADVLGPRAPMAPFLNILCVLLSTVRNMVSID